MVKAVFFDLDDTLYDTTLQVNRAREDAVSAMVKAGLPATCEEAAQVLGEVVSKKGPNYPRHFDDVLRKFGLKTNPKILAAGIVAYHEAKRRHLKPYPDTFITIRRLSGSGYRLGVVTDGVPVKQWEKLIRLGLDGLFDTVVITDEGGLQKPSPRPFIKAASEVKVKTGECMVVGDRLDRDIAGGRRAGMVTVQLVCGRHATRPLSEKSEEPDYIITRLADLLEILEVA